MLCERHLCLDERWAARKDAFDAWWVSDLLFRTGVEHRIYTFRVTFVGVFENRAPPKSHGLSSCPILTHIFSPKQFKITFAIIQEVQSLIFRHVNLLVVEIRMAVPLVLTHPETKRKSLYGTLAGLLSRWFLIFPVGFPTTWGISREYELCLFFFWVPLFANPSVCGERIARQIWTILWMSSGGWSILSDAIWGGHLPFLIFVDPRRAKWTP